MTWPRPAALALALAAVIAAGAAGFALTSHVSYWLALYWAVATATTVGYGDVVPKGGAAEGVAVGVMLTAIPLMGWLFSAVTSLHLRRHVHAAVQAAVREQGDNKESEA